VWQKSGKKPENCGKVPGGKNSLPKGYVIIAAGIFSLLNLPWIISFLLPVAVVPPEAMWSVLASRAMLPNVI
jgi:hypothetical protein